MTPPPSRKKKRTPKPVLAWAWLGMKGEILPRCIDTNPRYWTWGKPVRVRIAVVSPKRKGKP